MDTNTEKPMDTSTEANFARENEAIDSLKALVNEEGAELQRVALEVAEVKQDQAAQAAQPVAEKPGSIFPVLTIGPNGEREVAS